MALHTDHDNVIRQERLPVDRLDASQPRQFADPAPEEAEILGQYRERLKKLHLRRAVADAEAVRGLARSASTTSVCEFYSMVDGQPGQPAGHGELARSNQPPTTQVRIQLASSRDYEYYPYGAAGFGACEDQGEHYLIQSWP